MYCLLARKPKSPSAYRFGNLFLENTSSSYDRNSYSTVSPCEKGVHHTPFTLQGSLTSPLGNSSSSFSPGNTVRDCMSEFSTKMPAGSTNDCLPRYRPECPCSCYTFWVSWPVVRSHVKEQHMLCSSYLIVSMKEPYSIDSILTGRMSSLDTCIASLSQMPAS